MGARLVRGSGPNARVGRIVEVEAYIGEEDQACHARTGPTRRNAVMFGPPGRAYVYLVYGMYHCLNVVTEAEDRPAAVLVRSVEPLEGLDAMRDARRAMRRSGPPADARLAAGPGLVCAALSITRADNGVNLFDPESDLRLELAPRDEALPVATGPRVGIDYAPEPWRSIPWRFYVPGNASVSTARATTQRRAAR